MTATRAVPSVVFAAGGTGGHVRPALAVLSSLRGLAEREGATLRVRWLCSGRGDAERPLAGAGIERTALFPSAPGGAPGLGRPAAWLSALLRARRVIAGEPTALVAGFGGYVTAVAAAAAVGRKGVRLVLCEQNARAGRAVRLFARRAERLFCPFEETVAALPRGVRADVVGTPVDPAFADLPPPEERHVLVLGGSQGARALDRMAIEAARLLAERGAEVTWTIVTGPAHFEAARGWLRSAGPAERVVELLPFTDRPERLVARASLVVSRAGGATIAELLAAGRPSLLVPYPFARDDHQRRNAEAVVRRGAGWLFEQERGARPLADRVQGLLADPDRLERAGAAARAAARPQAAEEMARALLEMVAGADR